MHIPDGFLNNQAAYGLGAAAAGALAHSFSRVAREVKIRVGILREKLATSRGQGEGSRRYSIAIPQKLEDMARLGALIFALQMLNFPVRDGTSGHFLGAVLATAVVGPYAAILVMSGVVAVQAVIFADGGLLALGANIFNMAVIGVVTASAWFYLLRHRRQSSGSSRMSIIALAAWSSVVLAALAGSVEIALSGTISLQAMLTSMLAVHMLIGLGEALLTLVALKLFFPGRQLYLEEKDDVA